MPKKPRRNLTDADVEALADAVAAKLRPLPGNGLHYRFDLDPILPPLSAGSTLTIAYPYWLT